MRVVRDQAGRDAGEMLVEILVAVTILAVGVVGIMSALASNVHATSSNRNQAIGMAVLASASEYVKSEGYSSCSVGARTLTTAEVPHDGSITVVVSPPTGVAGTACADGMQKVTITVTMPGQFGFQIAHDVVKARR